MATRADLQKKLFANKQVCEAFEGTYKENWKNVLGLEINYFDLSKVTASNINSNSFIEMFVALGMSEGATLNPIISEFYTAFQRGAWDLIPSRYLFMNLLMLKPNITYVQCFVIRECDFFKITSYDPLEGEPSGAMVTNDTQYVYQPSTDPNREKSPILHTLLHIKYSNSLDMVDIKAASFYEARKALARNKKIHNEWPDEFAEKTHLKHHIKKYGGVKKELLQLSSVLMGDLNSVHQEETIDTPQLSIEAVSTANSLKLLEQTFDTVPIVKDESEFEVVKTNLELIATSFDLTEFGTSTINPKWETFNKEQRTQLSKIIETKKKSFEAPPATLTLDDIK